MKKILITGKDSYIGTCFEKWVAQWPDEYNITTIDVRNDNWKKLDFSLYDSILHVAAIVHKKEKFKMEPLYMKVNCELPISIAQKAKNEGVGQFVFISSMSVYGISTGIIDANTIPFPKSYYGKSKLSGEKIISKLQNEKFNILILRPPMVYGNNGNGNYSKLVKLVKKSFLFPNINNERSMIYIDNLCEFLRLVITHNEKGLFFPQNKEYVNTKELVQVIANIYTKKIIFIKIFNPILYILRCFIKSVDKVFGSLIYIKNISAYSVEYQIVDFVESLKKTEKIKREERFNLEKLSQKELRNLQIKELEILVYLKKICNENNLLFYLGGGSCIGALRHKGFIPWDDDIDVFMPRMDYEELDHIWNSIADTSKYTLCRTNFNENYHHTAMSLNDNHTTFINKHSVNEDINHGVNIDILPFDACPASKIKRIKQIFFAMLFSLYNAQRLPNNKGKIWKFFSKIGLLVIPSKRIRYKVWRYSEKKMSKYKWEECDHVVELVTGFNAMKRPLPKEWFIKAKLCEFEGYEMPIPEGAEEYMTLIFGDYMQLPKIEERVAKHDVVYISLDETYKSYKKIYYCTDNGERKK